MPYCKGCHNEFAFSYINTNGYCKNCEDERARMRERLTAGMPKEEPKAPPPKMRQKHRSEIVMTTEAALDIPITRRLGIVTAEAVVGMNIIKDIMLEVRDLVGGRSKAQQNAMRDIKEELFNQLRDDATRLNADMIVGVDLRFSNFGNKGNAILATAIGTAVKVAKGGGANLPTTDNIQSTR
jgi:uncharacterized protein YbjQ (UPF0145 family)